MALNEVFYNSLAFGGEHRFGVELNTVDVEVLVFQCHYLSFVAHCSYLKAGGEILAAHHPGVIASHGDAFGQRVEYVVVGELCALRGYTMKDVAKVLKSASEHLADGLMT